MVLRGVAAAAGLSSRRSAAPGASTCWPATASARLICSARRRLFRVGVLFGGGLPLPALFDRADDDLDGQAEDDQVGDHLPGDQQPGGRGFGGDVAEADGGEDGDGEVQAVGVRQMLAEALDRERGQRDVGGGEQQQEQRDADGQGLDGPQLRERRAHDRADVEGDQGDERHQPDDQYGDNGRGGGGAIQRQQIVDGDQRG